MRSRREDGRLRENARARRRRSEIDALPFLHRRGHPIHFCERGVDERIPRGEQIRDGSMRIPEDVVDEARRLLRHLGSEPEVAVRHPFEIGSRTEDLGHG